MKNLQSKYKFNSLPLSIENGDNDENMLLMQYPRNDENIIKNLQENLLSPTILSSISYDILILENISIDRAKRLSTVINNKFNIADKVQQLKLLQQKASIHLEAVVTNLVERSTLLTNDNRELWKSK